MIKKRKKSDPLVSALESALDLGEFVSYNRSWDFVRDLEIERIRSLASNKDADDYCRVSALNAMAYAAVEATTNRHRW